MKMSIIILTFFVRISLKSLQTPASTLKIAWLAGVRRSSTLLSSLVSWFTRMFNAVSSASPIGLAASSICKGSCGLAALITNTSSIWTSTSFCEHDSIFDDTDFTTALTSIMDSFVILKVKQKHHVNDKKYIELKFQLIS